MTPFELAAILITLTALAGYLNVRYLGLPNTIGIMVVGLLMSLGLVLLDSFDVAFAHALKDIIRTVDFNTTLMQGMLSFLLFAGALHVNLGELRQQLGAILSLATLGVLVSTVFIGTLCWWAFAQLGLQLPYFHALLFGALISPTDPIAVMAILQKAGIQKEVEVQITGESLLNDGVGVVVFLLVLGFATGEAVSPASALLLFAREALGGAAFGLALGVLGFALLRRIDDYQIEVLITLAVVMGGYSLADRLHLSGPIAMVIAGLVIGNQGRALAMSDTTREHLDMFWRLLDEILNAVLFVLIGLELLVVRLQSNFLLAAIIAIPIVLLGRLVSILGPVSVLALRKRFVPGTISLLTWGGLRGGISVALALSLPAGPEHDLIVAVTYGVVLFSILVQGLSIGRLVDAIRRRQAARTEAP